MKFQEIVIISGKGGTGKTSLLASMIPFVGKTVIADCDVDAPDLHILLHPEIREREPFVGTNKAVINPAVCTSCMACVGSCRFNAISNDIKINRVKCEGCGVCAYICPMEAISLEPAVVGDLFSSETSYGPMVHARLIPGEETSGKLIAEVRKRAKKIAEEQELPVILIDGPPGIGCNVISSITGAKKIVIVTEPSESGYHDLVRVFGVTEKFYGRVYCIINRFDVSPEMTGRIENFCSENSIPVLMKIPFDRRMVDAITAREIPSVRESVFFSSLGWEDMINELVADSGKSGSSLRSGE